MADQIPSASRDPGDPDVECLVAVLDVDGRHGPLRLAHSVFNQSPTRWLLQFVDSFASLYKLSWANSFCIVKIHFRMKLYNFIFLQF